ncbi:hypothetical protein [Janthinobacterium sp. CAN_S7]|uniref:hypothetical protein n=1 Tax=Janthinobacterium sp. CAN_S7 TaxID=3071704 RepID=UPI00319E4AD1
MNLTKVVGPVLIVALIAAPSIMAYKTVSTSIAAACLEASAKEFDVPLQLLIAVDRVEFGGAAHGQACNRSADEAKALSRALAIAGGMRERALSVFYAGESGLRAYDSGVTGPHTHAAAKVIKQIKSESPSKVGSDVRNF